MGNWLAKLLASPPSSNKGLEYETRARDYLAARGLSLVTRNYRCRQGEIDLIMRQDDILVFVEVRYRASNGHGSALESVTTQKQNKIRMTARHYLARHQLNESKQACRFDVVAFDGEHCEWLPNAF